MTILLLQIQVIIHYRSIINLCMSCKEAIKQMKEGDSDLMLAVHCRIVLKGL